jgi:hypothetical protein
MTTLNARQIQLTKMCIEGFNDSALGFLKKFVCLFIGQFFHKKIVTQHDVNMTECGLAQNWEKFWQ